MNKKILPFFFAAALITFALAQSFSEAAGRRPKQKPSEPGKVQPEHPSLAVPVLPVSPAPVSPPAPSQPGEHAAPVETVILPVGLVFENPVFNFGEVFEGEMVRTEFLGTNRSDRPIRVLKANASCGCTVAKVSKDVVNPGEDVSIDVRFDTTAKRGQARKRVWLDTDFQPKPVFDLFVEGVVKRTATGHPVMDSEKNIFSPGCASCHSMKGMGKLGGELYQADCAMCHGAQREGTHIAPALNWTYGFAKNDAVVKTIIGTGSTNPMMPGFSAEKGGPLNVVQIDSLAAWIKAEAEREEGLVAEGKLDPNLKPAEAAH